MTRVLQLTSTRYGIGGVEALILESAGRYDSTVVEVCYTNLFDCREGQGAFPRRLAEVGADCCSVSGDSLLDLPAIIAALVRIVRSRQVDVVHAHMRQATIVAGLLCRILPRLKLLVTRHYLDGSSLSFTARLERLMLSHAHQVVAVSDAVAKSLSSIRLRHRTSVQVIHNGIDPARIRRHVSQVPHRTGNGTPCLTVVCVGSLRPEKGQEYLLRALQLMSHAGTGGRLILVGEGPEKNRLEQLARKLSIAQRVDFVGFQSNPAVFTAQADVYVQPSIAESFGVAILEAMAVGKPVVGTQVGGIPEVLDYGRCGVLVPPKDPVALSEAIQYVAHGRLPVQEMLAEASRLVEGPFHVDRMVKSYEAVYTQLAAQAAH